MITFHPSLELRGSDIVCDSATNTGSRIAINVFAITTVRESKIGELDIGIAGCETFRITGPTLNEFLNAKNWLIGELDCEDDEED